MGRVMEITGGKEANVIYDAIASPVLESLGNAVAIGGVIIDGIPSQDVEPQTAGLIEKCKEIWPTVRVNPTAEL